jgi:hypothetical protein
LSQLFEYFENFEAQGTRPAENVVQCGLIKEEAEVLV